MRGIGVEGGERHRNERGSGGKSFQNRRPRSGEIWTRKRFALTSQLKGRGKTLWRNSNLSTLKKNRSFEEKHTCTSRGKVRGIHKIPVGKRERVFREKTITSSTKNDRYRVIKGRRRKKTSLTSPQRGGKKPAVRGEERKDHGGKGWFRQKNKNQGGAQVQKSESA